MNIKSAFTLLVPVFFAAGCSTMRVSSDCDHGYGFGAVKTYQWVDGPAEVLDAEDTYTNEDIKTALNHEWARRNMRQVQDKSEADVQVAYYMKLKEEHEYTAPATRDEHEFSGGLVYTQKSGTWRFEEREPDLHAYAVEIGTLTVLVYDAGTGQRVWRGTLKTKIDRSQPEDRQQECIRRAVEKLMDRFPPTPN